MNRLWTALLALTLPAAGLSAAPPGKGWVWIEGEAAASHTARRHPWYDRVDRSALSGGDWLCHFSDAGPAEAEYRVRLDRAGTWRLWLRINPAASPRLSLKVGRAAWRPVDLSRAIQQLNIAADGKPDMRFIGWVDAGPLELKAGAVRLRLRFHSANNHHGALDCLVLARVPFRPRGILKPGARSGAADAGFFAWEPPVDPFSQGALLDLRGLNEPVAGGSGRIRAKGEGFVTGDGRPVRFWAVNAGPAVWRLDHASHRLLARTLAKRGVNLVRLHGGIYDARDPKVDKGRLDDIHHLVHALKAEGIYTALSFYFPAWYRLDPWHKQGDRWPVMLLFYCADMQRVYYEWARALLATRNPYTRLALAADPAVAMVEIQNEDSFFFHTFGRKQAPPARWRELQRLYGKWLRQKYGTAEKVRKAWGGAAERDDDPAAWRYDLYAAWFMTRRGTASLRGKRARLNDQVAFLAHTMRTFYGEAIARFRKLGYPGPVVCGNWHTADARQLDALERWCYTAGDVIDHHGYYGAHHQGAAASYAVRPGQSCRSSSALDLGRPNPLPFVETAGHPHIISEVGWPMPNRYRTEWTLLTALYGSLHGLDGIVHFAMNGSDWAAGVPKFALGTPVGLGAFYATAYLYRTGCVQPGPVVVRDVLDLEEQLALKGTDVHVGPALDAFRAERLSPDQRRRGPITGAIDPLTFYVGRVVRTFGGDRKRSFVQGLAGRVDRKAKVVRSATGELAWDWGRRTVTVDTPRAQGAVGFIGGRTLRLADLTLTLDNPYGMVLAVGLDGKPLARSRRILVQCLTVDRPRGWRTAGPAGAEGRIVAVGTSPWGMERIRARLSLAGPRPRRVVACDENGYPRPGRVEHRWRGGRLTLTVGGADPYTVIER